MLMMEQVMPRKCLQMSLTVTITTNVENPTMLREVGGHQHPCPQKGGCGPPTQPAGMGEHILATHSPRDLLSVGLRPEGRG